MKIALAVAYFHGFGVARQGPWITWVNSVGCLGRPIRAFRGNRPFGGCSRPLPALSFAASTQSMGWSRTRPYPNDTEEERRMPEKLMLVLSLTVVLVGIFGAVAVAEGELIQCKKSVTCYAGKGKTGS